MDECLAPRVEGLEFGVPVLRVSEFKSYPTP